MFVLGAPVAIELAQHTQIRPAAAACQQQAPSAGKELLKAEVLYTHGRKADAKAILLKLAKTPSGNRAEDNQVQFLLGLIDMDDEDYESAIARFHRVLVFDPKAVRVRLEMGRAYYMQGRYGLAERQFLYARAGHLPKAVLANVDRYLVAIRRRKVVNFNFSFAFTSDSNRNAGPATSTVSLFGLPFQLSPNAKQNSGIGLTVQASGEWAPRLGNRMSWRNGAQIYRVQYQQTQFDDMTLSLYTGPHVTLKRWDLNLLGNVAWRWYGEKSYSTSYGPSANATYFLTTHLGLGLSFNLSQIDYDLNSLQNGLGKGVGLSFFYTPTTASFLRGTASYARQDAKIAAYSFDSEQLGFSYVREFAGGLTVGLAPAVTRLKYDAALAAFSKPRRDWQYAIQVSLLDRRIDVYGLTPKLAYTFIRNDSNIGLYRFSRSRFDIGVTSSF